MIRHVWHTTLCCTVLCALLKRKIQTINVEKIYIKWYHIQQNPILLECNVLEGQINVSNVILQKIIENYYYFLVYSYFQNLYEVNVQKAVQYLEGKYDEGITGNYTLSIVTYALSLANSTKAQAALTLLNSRATNQVNGK